MTEQARQRRGRAIAMTTAEVDEFLASERTCRVAWLLLTPDKLVSWDFRKLAGLSR